MKKFLFIFCCSVIVTGCTREGLLLKRAEQHLLDHLDYPRSYNRISWKILDTTWQVDIYRNELLQTLRNEEDILKDLSERLPDLQLKIKRKKLEISQYENGILAYPGSTARNTRGKSPAATYYQNNLETELEQYLIDSAYQAQEMGLRDFRIDSLKNLIGSLENSRKSLGIHSILMEIRFRAKITPEEVGTFCSRIQKTDGEMEILDTFYDGVKLR